MCLPENIVPVWIEMKFKNDLNYSSENSLRQLSRKKTQVGEMVTANSPNNPNWV